MRWLKIIALLVSSAVAGALATVRMLLPRRDSEMVTPAGTQDDDPGRRQRMLRVAKLFAVFVVVLAVGGFLFAASGVYPIGASSGHWGITQTFLNFASRRAVVTHTIGGSVPSLDDPRLVLKGAGHYETGCRPCHGSPELPHPRIAAQMVPRPPYLPTAVPQWEPDELFYIVKNGLKFTGMPAWPAQVREDEVWAVVAFLLAMPDMDAETYRQLATGAVPEAGEAAPIHDLLGPEEVPRAVIESCGRCHGVDGLGRGLGAFPRLAGQSPTYLYASLVAYAEGERYSGIMEPIAAGLSLEEMRALARYYGSLEGLPLSPIQATAPAIERGKAIALTGVPTQGIPACADCHGPSDHRRNPFYPTHAGQYAEYLVLQLELFKKEQRGGTAYAHIMREVADQLTEEQMQDVALYYESLAINPDRAAP